MVSYIYNYEVDKLLLGVDLFRKILPHKKNNASTHNGEEGKFIEGLIKEFLTGALPKSVSVGSGFILFSRGQDVCSYQVDIIIYDHLNYAPMMKYGDSVIVSEKSVIAALSIKKKLRPQDIKKEIDSLSLIGSMCGKSGHPSPYLSIFSLDILNSTKRGNFEKTIQVVKNEILNSYSQRKNKWSYNELIDSLIVLDKFIIKKKSYKKVDDDQYTDYIMNGSNGNHRYIYLQMIIHGITKVIDERSGLDNSSTNIQFPKVDFMSLARISLCAKDRPLSQNKKNNIKSVSDPEAEIGFT